MVQHSGVQRAGRMLGRCAAKFGHRPRRVHDQFRRFQDDSVWARWPAASRFQLEHDKPAQPCELFGAVHGAGFLHVRSNYGSRGDAKHAIYDAGEFLMRAQNSITNRILAAFATIGLLAAPMGAQNSQPQAPPQRAAPVNPRQGPTPPPPPASRVERRRFDPR